MINIMNKEKDPLLSGEDAIKAENTLLKLKLGLEHGMEMCDSTLPPDVENQWLKSVYAFEQQFRNAKRIKLYDYLGQPSFKAYANLKPHQMRDERLRLEVIMENNNVKLSYLCEYDDATLYRFITEELFYHEVDDMRIPGLTLHFTYEEFHPNHEYDLQREATDFINAVYTREWDEQFDDIKITRDVSYGDRIYGHKETAALIRAFQETHGALKILDLEFEEVKVGHDLSRGVVYARLLISGGKDSGKPVHYRGVASLGFVRLDQYWYINRFDLPGFDGDSC